MSRPAKPGIAWRWSRRIPRNQEERWSRELEAACPLNWMIVENPGHVRLRIEAHFTSRAAADALRRRFGGRTERLKPLPVQPSRPVRIGSKLEIVHDEKVRRTAGRLVIPYGMAFGSGEHATTLMLLRALARRTDLERLSVLDLGTGSGVLALAARRLGSSRLAGIDFDPDAIRTARRNESLNFPSRRVRWQVGDAKRLRTTPRHGLILANLFSGILVEAAPRIARALEPQGELWLSGVLRSQQAEVAAAYRRAGLRLLKTTTRGKWVMQQWAKGRDARLTTAGE